MACCLNGARTVTAVGHTLNPRRHLRIVAMRNKRFARSRATIPPRIRIARWERAVPGHRTLGRRGNAGERADVPLPRTKIPLR